MSSAWEHEYPPQTKRTRTERTKRDEILDAAIERNGECASELLAEHILKAAQLAALETAW